MTLPDTLGIIGGTSLIIYGLFGKGAGYNDVERPLREEERTAPSKPFTRWGRVSFIGFGLVLMVLGFMGKFNG
jgi:hypothetical protein